MHKRRAERDDDRRSTSLTEAACQGTDPARQEVAWQDLASLRWPTVHPTSDRHGTHSGYPAAKVDTKVRSASINARAARHAGRSRAGVVVLGGPIQGTTDTTGEASQHVPAQWVRVAGVHDEAPRRLKNTPTKVRHLTAKVRQGRNSTDLVSPDHTGRNRLSVYRWLRCLRNRSESLSTICTLRVWAVVASLGPAVS